MLQCGINDSDTIMRSKQAHSWTAAPNVHALAEINNDASFDDLTDISTKNGQTLRDNNNN